MVNIRFILSPFYTGSSMYGCEIKTLFINPPFKVKINNYCQLYSIGKIITPPFHGINIL
jgi:hypothetical protein